VRPARLGAGEWVALVAALALLVSLLVTASLGWLLVAMLVVCVGLGLWVAFATATRPPALSVTASVLAFAVSTLTLVVLLIRLVTWSGGPPGGAYVGLLSLLALAGGAWAAIRDERTDLAESAYDPPAPRPAPPTIPRA
jgi:hypothetical protein